MIEKIIDLLEPSAEDEVLKYLANGWYIYDEGMTYIIMRKDINDGRCDS